MGFGLLFFGYLTEYILGMNGYGAFVFLLGYGLMFSGLVELEKYCHSFRWAKICCLVLGILSVYRTFAGIGDLFSLSFPFVNEQITGIVDWSDFFLVFVFHFCLTLSVRELAGKVSLPKIAVVSLRNLILGLIYYVLYVIYSFTETAGVWGLAMLAKLGWVLFECIMIFSCYRNICPADEGKRERKPSRFGFVNRFRAAFDKREQEAIEADRAYHTENARKRKEEYLSRLSEKQRRKEERKQRKD